MDAREIYMTATHSRMPFRDAIAWARARMDEHGVTDEQMIETARLRVEELKFEDFQARIRAAERRHCEADLYWRTNRWAEDGR
ncbi:hypothetical protein [Bradyrhizobium elkanii]|uniref:hypothetical protein n=1 Tax=Bradyrhizobium elkanii TaxID=29448 RepID=UPI0004B7275A|nr:hypothetical protein [Bradyrhizobium elkanii]WLC11870.1 hypothetical protein QIH86_21645 [Bradyrhizobium elkanii USDA 94]